MYEKFFGLTQTPFSIAPDPRYLFMGERHREALAHLLYGLDSGGGFVLLTGEVGAGKTTVCRCFLEHVPRRCNVAYIFNPKLTVNELLKSICDEFQIPVAATVEARASVKDFIDALNAFLLRTHAVGQNNVLIIDEAQHLTADVLEQLRLLTNLETNERKLLQIVLIGQPELRAVLARPELSQLAQRVIARYHLGTLNRGETSQYVSHRMAVAGFTGLLPFDQGALSLVHRYSRGVPRLINLLCDRALLGAYAEKRHDVDRRAVKRAARELFDSAFVGATSWTTAGFKSGRLTAAVAGGICMGALLVAMLQRPSGVPAATPSASIELPKSKSSSAMPSVALAPPTTPSNPSRIAASQPIESDSGQSASATSVPPLFRSKSDAWVELAALWGLPRTDAEDACPQYEPSGLRCFEGTGGLAMIRQLARPCILLLRDQNEKPAYVLLVGLDDTRATLKIGGKTQTMSLLSLGRLWQGDFATLWRAPPNYRAAISQGSVGPPVALLADRLARTAGLTLAEPKTVFDDELKQQVLRFQRAQGLVADGIAGPTTFMQLSSATGSGEPRLQREK